MNIYQDIITSKRAPSHHPKMARGDRAKIFAPFAALKGFEESVHARETRYIPRPELCDDRAEQLDRRLRSLKSGDTVTVTWFQRLKLEDGVELGEYRVSTGGYLAMHPDSGLLILTTAHIPTADIVDVGKR